MSKINFKNFEEKWQKKWEKAKIFESNPDKEKPKFFITFPFPYVNGGPHIGHAFTFLRCDAYARFKRMQGFNVLLPQSFHATGEPIVGAVKRLRENDEEQIEALKIYGISEEQIEEFKEKGAEELARFWMNWWIEDLKRYGYSADWRRTFITAITPQYNRFIEWQYNLLRKKGYVVQGTHPVIWCPNCQSPTGDHDRLKGEGESPIEYIILKFELENSGKIIPCGTLRPETIYGTTNIWINPEIEYCWCKVDNEVWLLSENAVNKLKDQLKKVEIIERIKGKELVGKKVKNLVTNQKLLILPAKFVDPNSATGIVMSVPSHAPYDWIALKELKENEEEIKKFGLNEAEVKSIEPISIIKVKEYGEHPAIEICNKMQIKSQVEIEKLEKATNEIYKKEYHTGILKENCGKYSNKRIAEVKEEIVRDFIKENIADKMWELTGLVVCRCKTKCHVKVLENQWFLKFSDEEWKKRVKECIEKMKFYPAKVREQFINTVDWLKDKACTRKSGLGTRLPWDKEWIIETLSDSVIYMALYTIWDIAKNIPVEKLTDEVFNYVFLGEGDLESVSKISGLDKELIERMRKEFEYFYPVDLRTSGKDLIQNHLVFFIFHHVAIWPEKYWPKAIAINGFVNVEGKKMSKRFGNVITLRELLDRLGTDLVRINIISSNENMDDADWREENVNAFKERIEWIAEIIENIDKANRSNELNIDKFLLSKIQKYIESTEKYYEELKFRSVIQTAFFDFINNLKWYFERCGKIENCNKEVLKYAISIWIKLMAPIIPHICEEFWEKLGNKNFVSLERWPGIDKKLINEKSELSEEFVKKTIEDIEEIEKIVNKKAKKVYLIVAPEWKFYVYKIFLENKDKSIRELIALVGDRVKVEKSKLSKFLQVLIKKKFEIEEKILDRNSQFEILKEAKEFVEEKIKAKIFVEDAEKSKIEKADKAMPNKLAILIE